MASTEEIGQHGICSLRTRARNPACVRITSLARASYPSTSLVGSASAKPSSCASFSADSKLAPVASILVRIKLQVPLSTPAIL